MQRRATKEERRQIADPLGYLADAVCRQVIDDLTDLKPCPALKSGDLDSALWFFFHHQELFREYDIPQAKLDRLARWCNFVYYSMEVAP